MKLINSWDNTAIAYETIGKGPALVIVGGSLADHQMYQPLALALSKAVTVYNYDRRNRGESGASANHSIKNELEDLNAIGSLAGTPVIYGHSAGAALAIRAAASGLRMKKLIVADLPFSPLNDESGAEAERFEQERQEILSYLKAGDKSGAVKRFLRDFGMDEQELDAFLASEEGRKALAIGTTLPVDYDLLGNGITPANQLSKIDVPTLILTSGYGSAAAEDAAKHLSNCRIEVFENPIYNTPPDETATHILRFVEETS